MSRSLYLLLFIALVQLAAHAQESLSLSGEWEVAFDMDDAGSHRMLKRRMQQKLHLPGTTDEAGLGVPLTAKPGLNRESLYQLARRHRFIGTAWYRRTVHIPENWKGKQIEMHLERVLWQSRVFVDDKEAALQQESLTTPHRYDLTQLLTPGTHTLLIRINNTRQYDITYQNLAHAYTDGTQTIWNGVLGEMRLIAHDPVRVRHLRTDPDEKTRSVAVNVTFENSTGNVQQGVLTLMASLHGKTLPVTEQPVRVEPGKAVVAVNYDLSSYFERWDEFSPAVYRLKITFESEPSGVKSETETTFGVRTLSNENSVLHINGRRLFLRGTLESAIFPLTGHPPVEKAGWRKVFETARSYGLNHIRFHSYCPPKAAFQVADSLGFYLQVELPMWSLQVGEDPKADRFISEEADRIGAEYGNHPSFCFWSMGNELEGRFEFLNNLVTRLKKNDSRHLYATTTYSFQSPHGGWPEPADDIFITQQTKLGWVRGQGIFNQKPPSFREDYAGSLTGLPVPLVTHEVGQYAVYPNVQEISKYTGVLVPNNLIAIREDLNKKQLLPYADAFVKASGKLAAILYKEELERILRTKGASGIQLLDLHDFPGQGTADIGLLDAFWESKGILTAEEFRKFCSPVVPLLRFDKAVYTNQETFRASAELANFGESALTNVILQWTLTDDTGKQIAAGSLKAVTIAVGNGEGLGEINLKLSSLKKATRLTVTLSLKNTPFINSWSIWVYPEKLPEIKTEVVFTQSVGEAVQALADGKTVLLNPDYKQLKGIEGKFVPVFWSPVHFPEQAGAMGLLCDPKHPALQSFPTDYHTNWQWWELSTRSTAMILPDNSISPVVRSIDNFANNRRLANIFEASVGKGKLIVCSFDISVDLGNRPVARQLRHSLLTYMNSGDFQPTENLTPESLLSILNAEK